MKAVKLETYTEIVGRPAIRQLQQLASGLKGATVVHVNSTRVGGGVAEILAWLVPLMNDLGLEASWETIDGTPEFFHVTKDFHNGLQGKQVVLPQSKTETYEEVVSDNAKRLRPILEAADFVIIHDPQPAFLLNLCPDRKGLWTWRCHINVGQPNRAVWQYLRPIVEEYDSSIYSMPRFAQRLDHPQFIIAPSIDPLSEKNCELTDDEVASTMRRLEIDTDRPIISQISRFDRFKDPVGVIQAFKLMSDGTDAQLVLAGGGATDDPEGAAVYDEVMEAAREDERIKILMLPGDAHRTINAIQRASAVVVQKSLREGFGLTVTEAMWKSRPVIGGNTGGIRLQVHNHHTGFLVESPQGAALRIRELLRDPAKCERLGETAKVFVTENFLLNRHLREYLTLLVGLRKGLTDHLLAF